MVVKYGNDHLPLSQWHIDFYMASGADNARSRFQFKIDEHHQRDRYSPLLPGGLGWRNSFRLFHSIVFNWEVSLFIYLFIYLCFFLTFPLLEGYEFLSVSHRVDSLMDVADITFFFSHWVDCFIFFPFNWVISCRCLRYQKLVYFYQLTTELIRW